MIRFFLFFIFLPSVPFAQGGSPSSDFVLARLKYHGGGDWYNNPSVIPNLLKFVADNTNITTASEESIVEITDEALFSFPVIYMTGHGKVFFSKEEVSRLRHYLMSGGFLYADDDYGMDQTFRREISKVLPEAGMIELPFSHDIYHNHFSFPAGLPKIHEHDNKPPRGYGIFHEGRMVVYYTYETNISDGWADSNVHGDPPEIRHKALQMGTNILVYALTN